MLSVLLNGSVQLLFFQHVYVFVQWSCTCFMEIKCAYLEMYVLMGMCLQYYLNFFMEMTRCISLKMQKKKSIQHCCHNQMFHATLFLWVKNGQCTYVFRLNENVHICVFFV